MATIGDGDYTSWQLEEVSVEFLRHTLENGLQIVAEENGDAHSTALGFIVQTGARDENDALSGVSHFLEHMVFKGTPTRSADDVNREFDEMGAHYNAFTSEEHTMYYAAVLPELQQRCVELLGDLMRPSLREEDFTTEKKVIIEEIRMYEDQPPFGADEKIKATFFNAHPLGRSVLGTIDSIEALSADQMRDYFQCRYSPGNLILAGAGRIDFSALVEQADRLCGPWSAAEVERATPEFSPQTGIHVIQREASVQQYILQLMRGPGAQDEDRYAAKILATILGDDTGSRFYWEFVDSGQAEHASLGHYEYQDAGVFMSYLSCEPQQANENLQRMEDIYRAVEGEGIRAEELKQAQTKVKARTVLSGERPRSRLFTVGGNWASRREYRSVKDDLKAVDAVTLEEVQAVLAKYPLTHNTTMAIGPLRELGAR